MLNDKTGKIIKRVGSKIDLKEISIKVINRCAIIGVKVVKEVRKGVINRNIGVFSGWRVDIKGGNYYTICWI